MPPKLTSTADGVLYDEDTILVNANFIVANRAYRYLSAKKLEKASPIATAVRALEDEFLFSVGGDATVGSVAVPRDERANFNICGLCGSLPLRRDVAKALYEMGAPSLVGVEGKGDVLDGEIRLSRELGAPALGGLSELLANFEFPNEAEEIRQRLCPTAEKVVFRPYKLVMYRKGDFFRSHVDSMSHPLQFGSLALHIPVMDGPDDDDLPPSSTDGEGYYDIEDCNLGSGQLLLRLGRQLTDDFNGRGQLDPLSREDLIRNSDWGQHRDGIADQDELTLRVDMNGAGAEAADGALQVQFAAWLGDVPHEVTQVRQGFRFVLTYRMFKEGAVPLTIPRWGHIDRLLLGVMQLLPVAVPVPRVMLSEGISEEKHRTLFGAANLGIVLRHAYPPAGLIPGALKGIDAVVFQLVSLRFECELLSTFEMLDGLLRAPFHIKSHDESARHGPVLRTMWKTEDPRKRHSISNAHLEETYDGGLLVSNCVWLQLGFGRVLGGGSSYGNADCGAAWWYRNATLIVHNKPSRWSRRKWLLFAGMFGPPTMRRLFAVRDVFEVALSFA